MKTSIIYTVGVQGEDVQQITIAEEGVYFPRFSPDGNQLAAMKQRERELIVINMDSG